MAPSAEALTKYRILETLDGGKTWTYIADQLAPSSEQALRRHFADPPAESEGLFAAVSENAFKARKAKARVSTSLEEVELSAPEPIAPVGTPEPGLPE